MKKNNLFKELCIPNEWWEYCYISENNQVFTPIFDIHDNMLKTGEEYHNSCLTH